jgi:hypothetical protein
MKKSEIKKCSRRFLKNFILHFHKNETSLLESFKEMIKKKQREILVLMTFHFLKKMKNLILYNYYICVTLMEWIQKYSTFQKKEMNTEKVSKKRILKKLIRNEKMNSLEEFYIFQIFHSKKKLYFSIIFIQLYLRIVDLIKKEKEMEIINMNRILNQKYNHDKT